MPNSSPITRRDQVKALYNAASYRPELLIAILLFSIIAAALEGIGLSFLLPIVKLAQDPASANVSGDIEMFVNLFQVLNIPFVIEYVVIVMAVIFGIRYTSSFLVGWWRATLAQGYVRFLQNQAYEKALQAQISYFDEKGSDEIMNTIVTEAGQAGSTLNLSTKIIEQSMIVTMYLSIALYISPELSLIAAVLLGLLTFVFRSWFEPGTDLGDRIAEAHQEIHRYSQAAMYGIRDVKLFGMAGELSEGFSRIVDIKADSRIKVKRNETAMNDFYNLATVITLLILIYSGLTFSGLTLASLGVFLFAMFRLAPRVSTLTQIVYRLESQIPHVHRTQQFLREIDSRKEPSDGVEQVPESINRIVFDNVEFSYITTNETVFEDLSFTVAGDEFAAFVGPSGAGKSTIASLLSRMYEPDVGEIRVNGTPISEYDIEEWRTHVSVVQQQPFMFNETLKRNLTIANRDATQEEIHHVCEIAQVREFFDELPNGYDTMLGEDGVRLSGGQKQRVALARALLKDAELLVLDEATSDLDANIEEKVHKAIEEMDRDYAMIVIAHRLSTVMNADKIYAVKDGEIVESGSHDDLISQEGTYSDLYETQVQIR